MNQLTLEIFNGPVSSKQIEQKEQVLISILKDFNVAWLDKNWYLHSQDILFLDYELAEILVKRDIARKIDLSQSRPPEILRDQGGHDTTRTEA